MSEEQAAGAVARQFQMGGLHALTGPARLVEDMDRASLLYPLKGAASMPQEPAHPRDSLKSPHPIPADLEEMFELIAGRLYSMASMLVGEGEESGRLVEEAVANAEVSFCHDPMQARRSSLRALAAAALELLAERSPDSLAAPQGLAPASTCIEGDDLASAGISAEELESMISGPDRDQVRRWVASLPTWMRTVFVLRAVACFTAAETAALLQTHGGALAAGWTPESVSEVFRQGLCSLASQLHFASAGKGSF